MALASFALGSRYSTILNATSVVYKTIRQPERQKKNINEITNESLNKLWRLERHNFFFYHSELAAKEMEFLSLHRTVILFSNTPPYNGALGCVN